jgi:hypothetical protein
MIREIIEKIVRDKPKDEDSNSEIGKGEKGINGKKPILQKG